MNDVRIVGDWIEMGGVPVAKLVQRDAVASVTSEFAYWIEGREEVMRRVEQAEDEVLELRHEVKRRGERLAAVLQELDTLRASWDRLAAEDRDLRLRLKAQMMED